MKPNFRNARMTRHRDGEKLADRIPRARVIGMEIVKSYVRESLSSLTPRHFWALSTTSLMLTCVNSHLLTYVPLPLTTSRHRQCLISHSCYYCMPAWCTLYCDYVSHPHWASTSILDIFTTSSRHLHWCSMPVARCHLKFSSEMIPNCPQPHRLRQLMY